VFASDTPSDRRIGPIRPGLLSKAGEPTDGSDDTGVATRGIPGMTRAPACTHRGAAVLSTTPVQTVIATPLGPRSLRIPRSERWRIDEVIRRDCYRVPVELLGRPVRTVIDVGANVGAYTLHAWSRHRRATIHAFEPAPGTAELLRENVGDLPGVVVHEVALTDRDGVEPLHLSPRNTGQHSLRFVGPRAGDAIPVSTRHAGAEIDRVAPGPIDVLKIDTEGSEVAILEAMGPALRRRVAFVALEYHAEPDRRRIDHLLRDFSLLGVEVPRPGCGVARYVRTDLVPTSRRREVAHSWRSASMGSIRAARNAG